MELEENIYNPVETERLFLHLTQKTYGIDSLYHGYVGCNILHLVGLEMAYEVPLYVGGKRWNLCLQFLLMALAKDALTIVIGHLYIGSWMVFAYGNEPYPLRQGVQNLKKIYLYIVHGEGLFVCVARTLYATVF